MLPIMKLPWIAFVVLASCGGPASTQTTPSSTGSATATASDFPCWPVAPMQLLALEHGAEWVPIAEIQGDGWIYNTKKERHFVARVSNDALLDMHDVPNMTCIHREIDIAGGQNKGHYDASDAYVDARTRIEVGDDGMVTLNGSAPKSVKVVGVVPKTRRTAVLLVIAALIQ